MSRMISSLVGRLAGPVAGSSRAISLPPVEIHSVETNPDRRARCLKHLLKANHVNYAILYNHLRFDNHNPHILASAYLLGATETQLHTIFEKEIQVLEPWKPSPAELIDEDWRDFWGDARYERAFVDYFEDKLVMKFSYDWKKEAIHFMFDGEKPLVHGMIGGLGHSLIHMGFAVEVDSRELAMEALAMGCTQYNYFHKYMDDPAYDKPSPLLGSSPTELLQKLSQDARFAKLPSPPRLEDLEQILSDHEEEVLEYWNALDMRNPTQQFEAAQEAAVALLVATVRPGTHAYNFVLVHLLTSSHAVRILLSFVPVEHHVALVREWWLLVIGLSIVTGRRAIDPDYVEKDLKGKHWAYVDDKALNSQWSTDAHFVKACRTLKECARTWGDVHERYLAAAVTFVDNFNGWTF